MSGGRVGIGVIGYGAMGRAHSYAFNALPILRTLPVRPALTMISGRHEAAVASAAKALGFERWTTDWRRVVEDPAVDIVDVCTPPGTHAEIVQAAARHGKAVYCEKPFTVSLASGRATVDAVAAAGVLNATGFNYRYLPAVSLMCELIREGEIGDVLLWRGSFLSDEFLDPAIPHDWRFDRSMGGSTIADLGSHLVDLAQWMVGPVAEVCAQSATFVANRAGPEGAPVDVDVDDASSALLQFGNCARGVLEVARTCARRPCDFSIEVNGTRGTVVFDYARLNELRFGAAGDDARLYGMRTIRAEHPTAHRYAGDWWALGQGVGYEASFINFFGDLLEAWPDGPWEPDLAVGLAVQEVCDAMERSASARAWVSVEHRT